MDNENKIDLFYYPWYKVQKLLENVQYRIVFIRLEIVYTKTSPV